MTSEILWKLFNKTGNIKYYNLLKKIRSDEENEKRNYKESIATSDRDNNSTSNSNNQS